MVSLDGGKLGFGGSLETLREDVVAICANGEFKFLGLPAKFLEEDSKSESDSCSLCGESIQFCGLVSKT